ncbi:DUF4304 domain-containing protein [Mucilaginibacter rubeus]|uniref:DUF4304 domain-containing protein n=1 Tax=Mucilaginibacter rubeus TaxID=2027860 RepID=A0AAE6JAX1_9SPHI|nr:MULTISPECIES: DUF4304 domain-containing protein [Mucilaginibacter]QEM02262.1 DUF4304 domain-containing protein [Mucilaginibacter rubeus]QEM14888.1 DUF4304 domain-containing protein [Mucilaginibacter gossypii]QTE42397.1 DUF4304 domain-containing protein [Mucilaginibacter rubeus]QTE49000.1 DUF4304 domain-containing protein [Mucilaginibacter rubeus]QTE54098.1 DUF4304 domain-containing protein [Mucilaginibacter rubeus]
MDFLSNLFRLKPSIDPTLQAAPGRSGKEKQLTFIRDSLKPLLKAEGYKTAGNKWWKFNGSFFNFIELQNFSWNSMNSVDFCFNFTTGLTTDIKNGNKPTIHDGIPHIRESYFEVKKNEYWKGANGYHIDDITDLDRFTKQIIADFELLILPKFNSLTNKESIVDFYSDEFWAPRIKQSLALGYKDVRMDN